MISLIFESESILTKSLGKRVGEELNIPVYLYGVAADVSYRKNLADIRRGEYEGMAEKMKRPVPLSCFPSPGSAVRFSQWLDPR